MKIVYLFQSSRASILLEKMIIPQISMEEHGAKIVGMFFFHDNVYFFLPEHPIGEKLAMLSAKYRFFIKCCDYCCNQRGISGRLYPGITEGCFPDLYKLAEETKADHVITL
jgi:sulfur relay (sulfurtransferase) complex TusBCD TusD component (DsrE family)